MVYGTRWIQKEMNNKNGGLIMGNQLITIAKREGSKIKNSQSSTIETDQPTTDRKKAVLNFFLWSMEHDGLLGGGQVAEK